MARKKVIEVEVEEEKKEPIKEEKVEVVRKEEHKSNSRAVGLISVLLTLLVCVAAFVLFYQYYLKNLVVETTKLVKDVTITDAGIADAVEKVYDSVVVVKTYNRGKEYASGTGFVYKTDDKYGYIITNNHVISNSTEVKVVFSNDKTYDASVLGSDEYSDIAVLRVEGKAVIEVAKIGKSESMRVGDTTFAVGAPIDSKTFSWSVTRGILSGKNRIVEVDNNNVMHVLQTDTAINSGNSGGPLCNSNGEVVGVTNMKLASSQIEGIGFAIPIEDATKIAESIIKGEKITRPYIGVSIYDAGSYYGRSDVTGVFIEYVEEGGAADKAGLKRGDKIIKVNDKEVNSTAYFKYELYKYNVGDKVKITVERNGKEQTFTLVLGTRTDLN